MAGQTDAKDEGKYGWKQGFYFAFYCSQRPYAAYMLLQEGPSLQATSKRVTRV
jgi:hypothetical protein